MDFVYVGSGLIKLCGCSLVDSAFYIEYKYAVGEILCVCKTASKKGKIEKVCVKIVEFVSDAFGDTVVNYKDTYNRIWIEYELCTLAEGVDMAKEYLDAQIEIMKERECC